jgi:hypothetical protein
MNITNANGVAMTTHTALCNEAKCAACYGTEVGQAQFFCSACRRNIGYCVGGSYIGEPFDADAAICDDCGGHTYNVEGGDCTLVEFLDSNVNLAPAELARIFALKVGEVAHLGGGAYAHFQVGRTS